jgi:hypothetical protein
MEAVKKEGYTLMYADAALRRDRAVVMEAVKTNGLSLVWAHESLHADEGLLRAAGLDREEFQAYARQVLGPFPD